MAQAYPFYDPKYIEISALAGSTTSSEQSISVASQNGEMAVVTGISSSNVSADQIYLKLTPDTGSEYTHPAHMTGTFDKPLKMDNPFFSKLTYKVENRSGGPVNVKIRLDVYRVKITTMDRIIHNLEMKENDNLLDRTYELSEKIQAGIIRPVSVVSRAEIPSLIALIQKGE